MLQRMRHTTSVRRYSKAAVSTTVGPDIHAKVSRTIYSVPWRFISQRVARETFTVVQIFHNGQLIATYACSRASRPTSANTRGRRSRSGCAQSDSGGQDQSLGGQDRGGDSDWSEREQDRGGDEHRRVEQEDPPEQRHAEWPPQV
jgi:hypothetical protein